MGLSLILGWYVIGRVHGRFPFLFPLGRRFLAVPNGSVASFVDHAMLLLVKRVQGAKRDAQIAVFDLCIGKEESVQTENENYRRAPLYVLVLIHADETNTTETLPKVSSTIFTCQFLSASISSLISF